MVAEAKIFDSDPFISNVSSYVFLPVPAIFANVQISKVPPVSYFGFASVL